MTTELSDDAIRAVVMKYLRDHNASTESWKRFTFDSGPYDVTVVRIDVMEMLRDAIAADRALVASQAQPAAEPQKLWLWKNFVNGRPEFWAFDNPFPIHLDNGDPQTLGEPCGYAIFKPSRQGRTDVSEAEVLRRIHGSNCPRAEPRQDSVHSVEGQDEFDAWRQS